MCGADRGAASPLRDGEACVADGGDRVVVHGAEGRTTDLEVHCGERKSDDGRTSGGSGGMCGRDAFFGSGRFESDGADDKTGAGEQVAAKVARAL